MARRHLPVRPDLTQLRNQAKDLLRAVHAGDPTAVAELQEHHPKVEDPARAKLADAQHALAHSYGVASWPRLVLACRMTDAIWRDEWIPAVGERDDAKVLHFLRHAHGTGVSYRVVTLTAFGDDAALAAARARIDGGDLAGHGRAGRGRDGPRLDG